MRAATLWILLCLIVGADSSRAQTPENPSYDFIIEGLVKDVRFEGAPDDAALALAPSVQGATGT